MVRKMIQLSEAQAQKLERRAKLEGVSMSELVRQGIDIVLETPSRKEELRRRAANAIGFASSGDRDVARRHDKYLAEIYANEHLR